MSSITKRLAKLTARRPPVEGPRVIYISSIGEDPFVAFIIGGKNVVREDGESAAAFRTRAMMAAETAQRE
jgi:hypothetical protein